MAFRDIKQNIQLDVPDIDIITIGIRVNKRYQQLLKFWQWSFLKGQRVLGTVAPYGTGTVDVTNGSTTVTGTGTTFTSAMAGRQLRVGNADAYYEISAFVSTTEITLKSSYAGVTASGQTFSLFQNVYSLASDVKELYTINYNFRLREKDAEYLDRWDAARKSTGPPEWYVYRGKDSSGNQQIELYPVPASTYELRYLYYKKVANMSADTDEPLIREDALEIGTLIDCYRMLIVKSRSAIEKAAYRDLLRDARDEFNRLLAEAMMEDSRIESQRSNVKDAYEPLSYSDTYFASHDVDYWNTL